MAIHIRRRDFIALLGGAAAAWPLAARAQQTERVRRVAFLHGLPEGDPEARARVTAFRQELETLGWKEGRNIEIVGLDGSPLQRLVLDPPPEGDRAQTALAMRSGPRSAGSRLP